MAADLLTPLATVAQFEEGPLANLVSGFSTVAKQNLMMNATRSCESACDRRLAPFVGIVETQRADMLDVEDTVDAYMPLDPTAQLGFSRSQSLGSTLLVRHFWVREYPPRYPDLWTGAVTAISLYMSYSGQEAVSMSGVQYEPDTGHCRFALGTYVPPGTTIQVTYSGGYSVVPGDLVEACKFMAAGSVVKQLDPVDGRSGHDPDALRNEAMEMLAGYVRR